mmetsp:Transcript_25945/g.40608  ORF Transcript_25945/g.40608 Transcript_25945/m.40608 type:complete len:84 (-) Transcript_25945:20-271(-)
MQGTEVSGNRCSKGAVVWHETDVQELPTGTATSRNNSRNSKTQNRVGGRSVNEDGTKICQWQHVWQLLERRRFLLNVPLFTFG